MTKARDLNWIYKFEQLQLFREIFGHCVIPQRYYNDPSLGSWVSKQRFFFKNLKMNLGRNTLLKKIEFIWSPPKNFYFLTLWNKHYLELCYFKKVYGHCNVPNNFKDNISLGFWVKNQRQLLKKNSLEKYKTNLLGQIGFEWERRKIFSRISWLCRLSELFNYLKLNGIITIPQRHGSVGKWVQKQREYLKKNQINERRIKLFKIFKFNKDIKNCQKFYKFKTNLSNSRVYFFLNL